MDYPDLAYLCMSYRWLRVLDWYRVERSTSSTLKPDFPCYIFRRLLVPKYLSNVLQESLAYCG